MFGNLEGCIEHSSKDGQVTIRGRRCPSKAVGDGTEEPTAIVGLNNKSVQTGKEFIVEGEDDIAFKGVASIGQFVRQIGGGGIEGNPILRGKIVLKTELGSAFAFQRQGITRLLLTG